MADELYVPLGSLISAEVWPSDVLGTANFDFLDGIAYSGGSIFDDEFGTNIELNLDVVTETIFDLPVGFAIVFGAGPVEFWMGGDEHGFEAWVQAGIVKLRLPRDLFVPVIADEEGKTVEDPDPTHFTEITFELGLQYDSDGNIDLQFPAEGERTPLALPRCMLGNTGIVLSADDVIVRLSDGQTLPDAAYGYGLDPTWRGLYIGQGKIELPEGLASAIPTDVALVFDKCFIGTGGFSGEVSAQATSAPPTELFGAEFTFKSLSVVVEQNALTKFELKGALKLAFFDQPLDVVVGVDLDGGILIGVSSEGGLIKLGVENIFDFTVDKLEFEIQDDGDLLVRTSGTLTPTFQPGGSFELEWPGIRLENLEIDSDGNVRVAGGWIDLPDHATLDLYGFVLEITKIGFGTTDDGRNWIGFNGSLRIMEGVPAGASVEGLRILWGGADPTPHLVMEGIGIQLEVPGAIKIAGSVALRETEFAGAVRVELPAVSFQLEGQFVAGRVPETNPPVMTYAVFLEMQLPAGIPLGPTGLAFYGLAGLYAHNREPAKLEGEGWYRGPDLVTDGWFTRKTGEPPRAGVTDLANKWRGAEGKMAVGAGVIVGTFPDNGFLFNGRVLLLLSFPGPIILLEGMANLFKKRTELTGGEPNFHAFVAIEPGKSFLAALDAQYKFAGGGELMEIRGSAEAYFDAQNARAWFINIGVDQPFEKRISARIFQLFDVGGFFMLNADRLFVGAGWRFHKRYGWKALNVTLDASMEGSAIVSWHPAHFTGSLGVQGSATLNAFGISAGISVGATIRGDVFDPFGLRGEFRAKLSLPWPLPDIGATIVIGWSHDFSEGRPPSLPVPIREVSIEHIKSRNSWPLAPGVSLLGDDAWNSGAASFERRGDDHPGAVPNPTPAEVTAPRIPADAKVALTFTRPIADPNLITLNPVTVDAEVIGNPHTRQAAYTAGYTLASIELQKWAPADEGNLEGGLTWVTIRQGGATVDERKKLVAAWLPGTEAQAENHSEQHKLFVNATSPFDYVAGRSDSWLEWFTAKNPDYPCSLAQPELTARFTQPVGSALSKPFAFESPWAPFTIEDWAYAGDIQESEEIIATVLGPIDRGLRVFDSVTVAPPPGTTDVLVRIGAPRLALTVAVSANGSQDFGSTFGKLEPGPQSNPLQYAPANFLPIYEYQRFTDRNGGTLAAANEVLLLPDGSVTLDIGERLEVAFPGDIMYVEMEIDVNSTATSDVEVFLVGANGVEGPRVPLPVGRTPLRLLLEGSAIARAVIRRTTPKGSAARRTASLRRIEARPPIEARVRGESGMVTLFYEEADGMIRIHLAEPIGEINLPTHVQSGFLVLELAIPGSNQDLIRHTQSSLSQLSADDPLFEPENDYRLVVKTVREDKAAGSTSTIVNNTNTHEHHAHFHVVGPPGIGTPDQPPDSQPGNTGLTDLRLYIEQTLPPTIPAEGDKLLLPRAFYRGFDVAVKFNENYGELFYLRARRALSVRLYDVDNQPVRRLDGRVHIPTPSWEQSRSLTLTDSTTLWIAMVNQSTCRPDDLPPFDENTVPRNQTVSPGPGADVVLRPETLYQARLVPALVHETFVDPLPGLVADGGAHRLERWVAEGASRWEIGARTVDLPGGPTTVQFVAETTSATSALFYDGPLGKVPDGPDVPSAWTDFRASVSLRLAGGTVGFEVRRASGADLLRVTLDAAGNVRLFQVAGGVPAQLAEATIPPPDSESDVPITVECVGDRVQVFFAGAATPTLEHSGVSARSGTVALYVEGAASPSFTEIRVDDLRDAPSAAFVFDFVTSRYTNFHHHLHSFSDQMFAGAPATALSAGDISAQAPYAVPLPGDNPDGLGAVTDSERRAFEALEAIAMGSEALKVPQAMEVFRISAADAPLAFMVRSPEPILWERTLLAVSAVSDPAPLEVPGELKLTDVAFGADAAGESVTILVRNGMSLANHRLEWRALPSSGDPEPVWNVYFAFPATEPVLQDGIQVRVLAVNASSNPPKEPGTELRFVATGSDPGVVHFVSPGVELRLLGPDGKEVVHQRRFRSPEAYFDFSMQALRKLDGTAAILITGPLSALPSSFRLRWTFNRGVGDEDLRYRQAGSETPEVAVLDMILPPAV